MAKELSPHAVPDTTPIYRLIRKTRQLLRSTWVATGLGLTVGLLVAALVLVTTVDMVLPLWWPVLRLLGLLLIVVPASWALVVGVLRPLFRRLSAGHVARRIEGHIPGIHNRLVSCIDLAAQNGEQKASPAFYRRLIGEALERIRGFRVSKVVDFFNLRRAGLFAAASVGVFLLAFGVFSDRLVTAMERIFNPFADIPPKSGVEYTVEPRDAKVLRGEDIVFAVNVEKGDPKKLVLEMHGQGGVDALKYPLPKPEHGPWKFTLSGKLPTGYENSFTYRVHGGGTWSKEYQITLVDRPRIVNYHTVLHYPQYMALPDRKDPDQTLEVSGPEDSEVEVVVQAEGDVAQGDVQWLDTRVRQVEVKDRAQRLWFEDKPPQNATAEGTWVFDQARHQRNAHTEPPALGEHGHWFHGTPKGFPVQPSESLFADVFIVPGQVPEAIMLEWHDGKNWEHRAYWGEDKIRLGKAGTAGRRRLGDLPPAGQWVRLEVPAAAVDLQGKSLHGMSFKLAGGQCYWSKAGALSASHVDQDELYPVKTFPMREIGDHLWSGWFPLRGQGLYRVELRNELNYPNKTMKEARFVAMPDNPPLVILQQPGTNLVLSQPGKVPLVIEAEDDYGLKDISLAVQRGDKGGFVSQLIKNYEQPVVRDQAVHTLDLAAMNLKAGEQIVYRAEARDRKGQLAKSPEYVIRLAADANAADQQLLALEKSQDPFREKLATLISEQAKVKEAVEKKAAKYAELDQKVREAQEKARAELEKSPQVNDPTKPKAPPAPESLKLDPAMEKALQELRKELAELTKQEQQNVQLAKQVATDLTRMAEQAANTKMLPREIADEMRKLQQAFENRALNPLQNLAAHLNQGADPRQSAPDLKGLEKESQRVQKELEAIRDMQKAVADAQKKLREDPEAAVAQLKKDMLNQNAGLTARELEELKEFIAALKEELKRLEGNQGQLMQEADNTLDKFLPEVEKKQARLDKEEDSALGKTKDLQASEEMKRMKRKPNFPKSPYDPDHGDKLVRPTEEDTEEPETGKTAKQDAKDPKAQADKDKKEKEEKEDLFLPALGGPKPKIDPRYADKMRPGTKKPKKGGPTSDKERREDLEAHQAKQAQDLERAEKSLESDEQSLEQMLQQLRNSMRANQSQNSRQSQNGEQQAQSLAQMMKSQALQQAIAMANRMKQMRQGQSSQQAQRPNQPQSTPNPTTGNMQGGQPPGQHLDAELEKLDLPTRQILMKMQPRLREELLQGMREEGPEGYRQFIQDYYKRLTEAKPSK